MSRLNLLQFLALMLSAFAMSTGLAHLLAMANKLALSGPDYLVAQRAYDGWAVLGVLLVATIVADLLLATRLPRGGGREWALLACGALTLGLITFFGWVFPANRQTENWTVQPADWVALRAQWETGHAVSAVLEVIALACVTWAVIQAARPVPARA